MSEVLDPPDTKTTPVTTLTFLPKDVLPALRTASAACGRAHLNQVEHTMVRLTATREGIRLTGGNGNMEITATAPLLKEPGKIGGALFDPKTLVKVLAALPPEEAVDLTLRNGNWANLRAPASKFRLRTLPAESYPARDIDASGEATFVTGDAVTLGTALGHSVDAVARDAGSADCRGMLSLDVGRGRVRCVGTDGYRLVTEDLEIQVQGGERAVAVPREVAETLVSMLVAAEGDTRLACYDRAITVELPNTHFTAGVSTAPFLQWRVALAPGLVHHIDVKKADLIDAIQRLLVVQDHDRRTPPWMTGTAAADQLVLKCDDGNKQDAVEELEARAGSQNVAFTVNPVFLRETLGALEDDYVRLSCSGEPTDAIAVRPIRSAGDVPTTPDFDRDPVVGIVAAVRR